MVQERVKLIADILAEHFEELEFLWGQRRDAVQSSDYVQREVAELEQRIEAHVQGLLVGQDAIIPLVEPALTGTDPLAVFAAAYALLRLNTEAAVRQVMAAFRSAQGQQLDGFQDAFCQVTSVSVLEQIRLVMDSAPGPVTAVAAAALAFHRQLDGQDTHLVALFQDEDPEVRRRAWRIVSLLGA